MKDICLVGGTVAVIVAIVVGCLILFSGGASCPKGEHEVQTGTTVIYANNSPIITPIFTCES